MILLDSPSAVGGASGKNLSGHKETPLFTFSGHQVSLSLSLSLFLFSLSLSLSPSLQLSFSLLYNMFTHTFTKSIKVTNYTGFEDTIHYLFCRLKVMLWIGQGRSLVGWQLVTVPKTSIFGTRETMGHGTWTRDLLWHTQNPWKTFSGVQMKQL